MKCTVPLPCTAPQAHGASAVGIKIKCWAASCSSVGPGPRSSAPPYFRPGEGGGVVWSLTLYVINLPRTRPGPEAGGRLVLAFPPAAPCAQFATATVRRREPRSCDRTSRLLPPARANSTARPVYPSALLHAPGTRSDAHPGPRPASCIQWPDTHGRTRQ